MIRWNARDRVMPLRRMRRPTNITPPTVGIRPSYVKGTVPPPCQRTRLCLSTHKEVNIISVFRDYYVHLPGHFLMVLGCARVGIFARRVVA